MDLETTVTELAPRLLRYCLGRTRDPALAEDVAQEALVALVRRWRRWGPPESPEAFVFSIARRRAWRRVWERRLLAPLSLLGLRADSGGDPQRHALARLEASDALRALRTLRAADREVLLLLLAVLVLPSRETPSSMPLLTNVGDVLATRAADGSIQLRRASDQAPRRGSAMLVLKGDLP